MKFTLNEFTPVEARLYGEKGEIMLPNRWYQAVNLTTTTAGNSEETVIDFVGNGYNYQAVEVQKCLDEGKIESPNWSHQSSLHLMELMDKIRLQCGIKYPSDNVKQ